MIEANGGTALFVLLLAHSPNRYAGMACVLGLAIARFSSGRPLCKERLTILVLNCIIFLTMIIAFLLNYSSLNNLIWGTLCFSPLISAGVLTETIGSKAKILSAFKTFLKIELLFVFGQYVLLVYRYGTLFVFRANSSAGDHFSGTFLHFSTPLAVTMALLSFVFFGQVFRLGKKDDIIYLFISLILMFITGAMSIVLPAVVMLIVYLIVLMRSHLSLKHIIVSTIFVFCFASLFFWQSRNFKYSLRILEHTIIYNPPVKIALAKNTLDAIFNKGDIPIYGVGIGNYSSRASMIVSGNYLTNQPSFIPVTPSFYAKKYILSIWGKYVKDRMIGGVKGSSMINEPFNQYTTLLAEGGVIAVFAQILCFLLMINWAIRWKSILLFIVCSFSVMIFMTNNWLEYLSYCCVFWLVFELILGESGTSNVKFRISW